MLYQLWYRCCPKLAYLHYITTRFNFKTNQHRTRKSLLKNNPPRPHLLNFTEEVYKFSFEKLTFIVNLHQKVTKILPLSAISKKNNFIVNLLCARESKLIVVKCFINCGTNVALSLPTNIK